MVDPFAGAEPTIPPYASWGRRFAAVLVDGVLLALPFVVIVIVAVGIAGGDDDSPAWVAVLVAWLLWILIPFPYYTLLHGGERGQTIGKRALGIRVIGEDFGRLGYVRAFYRYLVGWLLWLACYVPGVLNSLWPLWDDKNQAIHDKAVKSIVVRA